MRAQLEEFEPLNQYGETEWNHKYWVALEALFDCLGCGRTLRFQKTYDRFLHIESLAKPCKNVTCPRCETEHRHIQELDDDQEWVEIVERVYVNPNQLTLF
jgi:uncharacterized C2H2 Zn-finger protein